LAFYAFGAAVIEFFQKPLGHAKLAGGTVRNPNWGIKVMLGFATIPP
jgi:hypothetical protein